MIASLIGWLITDQQLHNKPRDKHSSSPGKSCKTCHFENRDWLETPPFLIHETDENPWQTEKFASLIKMAYDKDCRIDLFLWLLSSN